MNDDTLAILLLTTKFAMKNNDISPFSKLEWNEFVKKLIHSDIKKPSNLFSTSIEDMAQSLHIEESSALRIKGLLSRSGSATFKVNELKGIGIHIISKVDSTYPSTLKKKLKNDSPSILFYAGNIELLDYKMLGIVGTKTVDASSETFINEVVDEHVTVGFGIISGGSKGVEHLCELRALQNKGTVISVTSEGIKRTVRSVEYRKYLMNGQMLLLSEVLPDTTHRVLNSMNKNKYIYALSQYTIIVNSDYKKGVTWTGATENHQNKWSQSYVRIALDSPKGNQALHELGIEKYEGIDHCGTEISNASITQINMFDS